MKGDTFIDDLVRRDRRHFAIILSYMLKNKNLSKFFLIAEYLILNVLSSL
jgi:hypothetical protein